jgi:hypothetical protein
MLKFNLKYLFATNFLFSTPACKSFIFNFETLYSNTSISGEENPQSTYIYRVQSSVWRLPNY